LGGISAESADPGGECGHARGTHGRCRESRRRVVVGIIAVWSLRPAAVRAVQRKHGARAALWLSWRSRAAWFSGVPVAGSVACGPGCRGPGPGGDSAGWRAGGAARLGALGRRPARATSSAHAGPGEGTL